MARIATVLLTDDRAYDEAITHIPGAVVLTTTEELPSATELRPYTDILHTENTPTLPMNEDEAHELVNENGMITAVMPFDLGRLEDANPDSENSVYDMLHNEAFAFGFPVDCTWRALGMLDNQSTALVEYTFSWDEYRGSLDDAALTTWYTRYGFQLTNPESPEMKRVPSTDIISHTETNTEKERLPMKNPSNNTAAATAAAAPAKAGAFSAEAEQSLMDYVLVQIDDGADAEEITQAIIEQMSITEDIEEAIVEFGTEDHDQLAREIVKHLVHKFQR